MKKYFHKFIEWYNDLLERKGKVIIGWMNLIFLIIIVAGAADAVWKHAKSERMKTNNTAEYVPVGPCQYRTNSEVIKLADVAAMSVYADRFYAGKTFFTFHMETGWSQTVPVDGITISEMVASLKECRGDKTTLVNVN